MSLQSKPYYWLTCDAPDCLERNPSEDDEIVAWGDVPAALDAAIDGAWVLTEDGQHYCEEHSDLGRLEDPLRFRPSIARLPADSDQTSIDPAVQT